MSGILIESIHNERFKKLLRMNTDNRFRRKSTMFLVEGLKEIEAAMQYEYQLLEVYLDDKAAATQGLSFGDAPVFVLSQDLFSKLAYREKHSSAIAVFKTPVLGLEQLTIGENPLIVILENIEKPGNLGAILRTCDAAGVDAVIINGDPAAFFHPNVIRSSVGTVFTNQIAVANNEHISQWCRENQIKVYAAALQTNLWYTDVDYRGCSAFVMGAEDTGLSPFWRENSDQMVKIPMLGHNDSLNVSVSTAILVYEAQRQRLSSR